MIMGIDVGTRRVGVAMMHEEALLPTAYTTLDVSLLSPYKGLADICKSNDVKTVVIGFPRRQDGSTSPQTDKTMIFADELRSSLPTTIKIAFQDESLTSIKAEEELKKSGKLYAKAEIDSLAAVYILEDYAVQLRGIV